MTMLRNSLLELLPQRAAERNGAGSLRRFREAVGRRCGWGGGWGYHHHHFGPGFGIGYIGGGYGDGCYGDAPAV